MTKIKKFLSENINEYRHWTEQNDFGGIHIKILNYLKNIENGVFIETGAHDGIFQSTTKILEDLGWTGLLIEPSKNLYEKCLKNRNSISENYALVSSKYDKETINGDWIGNLILQQNGITLMGDEDEICDAITLTELCKKHKIFEVDFFSLDVEGYELEVLDGLDFNLINVRYCLVEWNQRLYSIDDLIRFMNEKNFEFVCNLSNFTKQNCPTWPGTHQDFLFLNKNYL